jgi:hypothetical protein
MRLTACYRTQDEGSTTQGQGESNNYDITFLYRLTDGPVVSVRPQSHGSHTAVAAQCARCWPAGWLPPPRSSPLCPAPRGHAGQILRDARREARGAVPRARASGRGQVARARGIPESGVCAQSVCAAELPAEQGRGRGGAIWRGVAAGAGRSGLGEATGARQPSVTPPAASTGKHSSTSLCSQCVRSLLKGTREVLFDSE